MVLKCIGIRSQQDHISNLVPSFELHHHIVHIVHCLVRAETSFRQAKPMPAAMAMYARTKV
jgi:hypothetical protein